MSQSQTVKFNFKSRTIRDDAGKEISKTKKQPPLTVSIPVPTVEEIISYLQRKDEVVEVKDKDGKIIEKDGQVVTEVKVDKVKQMILDAVQEIPRDYAKEQLDEVIDGFGTDETKVVTPQDIDYDKLSLEFIANLPPAQRGAKAIPEEDWETFYQDYMQVMVATTGKPETKIKNHIELFKKPTKAKQNKDALAVLVDQLDVYITTSSNIEDTAECANRLRSKFDKWVKEEDKLDINAL